MICGFPIVPERLLESFSPKIRIILIGSLVQFSEEAEEILPCAVSHVLMNRV